MRAFLAAIAFLTRIPIPAVEIKEEQWLKSSLYYPVVGLMIGILLYGFNALTSDILSLFVQASTVLVFWIFLTGGLHLDGLMDVGDGLGSNQTRDKVFEIMKDSRVGAMGVIAAFVLLLIKLSTIHDLLGAHIATIIIIPIIARFMLVVVIYFFPYKGSLGTGLRQYINKTKITVLLVCLVTLSIVMLQLTGLFLIILTLGAGILFSTYLYKKLGALNGDCYGAIVEVTEAMGLLFSVILWRML
jgi:adenosylcobinamide-GDP ribazoletransferase